MSGPATAPVVEARPRRPELPADLRWEWIVLVDGVWVGLGRQLECEALAEELRAAPSEALVWRELLRDTDSGL